MAFPNQDDASPAQSQAPNTPEPPQTSSASVGPEREEPHGSLGAGEGQAPSLDSLAESILTISRHHGKHRTLATLLAGLPLGPDGRLTPSMAARAAANVGLTGRIAKMPLDEVAPFALPALLFLKDNETCVLQGISGDHFSIIRAGEQDASFVAREELAESYIGFVMYLLPEKTEAQLIGGESPKVYLRRHWLFGTVLENWWPYTQVVVAAVMLNIFALASPLFVMNVYDRVVPNRALETLWVLAAGVLLVFCFDFTLKTLRAFFIDTTSKKVDIILEGKLFDKLLDMRLSEKTSPVGSLASLLRELEVLRESFTSATLTALVDMPFIVIFILLFWYIGGPISLVFMVALPMVVFIGLGVHLPMKHCIEANMASGYNKHTVLIETLSSMETVKGLGCESVMRRKWGQHCIESAKQYVRSKSLSQLAMNMTNFVQQVGYVVIIIVGVYLIKEGKLTMGGLVACSMLSGRVWGPFTNITQILSKLHHTASAYRELDKVMSLKGENSGSADFLHRPDIRGQVEFRGVSFSYPGCKLPSLKNVNMRIMPGERVGVVGRNGSGKSTLGKMILGLYEPDDGAVLVDGTDLRQLNPADLRRATAYVPQEVMLFQGTVRQNICMSHPQATDQQILNAALVSGTHDFMRTHPRGYDLLVGERGSTLSGGQRQAIGIARALIRTPSILVLDEPTSSMDNQAEALFVARLKQVLAGKTLFLITHRPNMLELVDRLIVMDEGQVVADGPKENVLRMLNSRGVPAAQATDGGGRQ